MNQMFTTKENWSVYGLHMGMMPIFQKVILIGSHGIKRRQYPKGVIAINDAINLGQRV
jgi:hypothetical protein